MLENQTHKAIEIPQEQFILESVIIWNMGNFGRDNNSGARGSYGNRGFSGGNSDREMFKATCADCGNACEIPFRPTNGRPVYCRDCFKKHSPDEGRGADAGRGNRSYSRDNSRGGDRPMFDAVCDNCGNDCKIPFQPREGKDTLCSKCFEEKGGDPRKNTGQVQVQIDAINLKLDKILELLSPSIIGTDKKELPSNLEVKNDKSSKKDIIELETPKVEAAEVIAPSDANEMEKVLTVKKPKTKKAAAKKS